jgi:glycosyltransferase involved in cell wall biosynthesis
VAPSHFAAADVKAAFGVAEGKISVIYNGVKDHLALAQAPPAQGTVFGFLGRLSPSKGILELMTAFEALKKTGAAAGAKLLVAGGGPLQAQIEALAAQMPEVVLLGSLPYEEVPAFLSRLHYLVVPSLHDNLPTTCIEALMMGTPVIATTVGGLPEIFTPDVEGFSLPSHQPEAMAEVLRKAIGFANTPNYQAMRARCRQRYEAQFTIAQNNRALASLMTQELPTQ